VLPPTTISTLNSSPLLYPIFFSVSPKENYIGVGTNLAVFRIFDFNTSTIIHTAASVPGAKGSVWTLD
jgi:hypothetical protein